MNPFYKVPFSSKTHSCHVASGPPCPPGLVRQVDITMRAAKENDIQTAEVRMIWSENIKSNHGLHPNAVKLPIKMVI